jgi:hypothetical protein
MTTAIIRIFRFKPSDPLILVYLSIGGRGAFLEPISARKRNSFTHNQAQQNVGGKVKKII